MVLLVFSFGAFGFSDTGAHMFWWLYRSPYRAESPSKPWPIILWLQGGPVSVILHHIKYKRNPEIHKSCLEFKICEFHSVGRFRSWDWEFSGDWSTGNRFEAQKFYMVEESRSVVCGKWHGCLHFRNWIFLVFALIFLCFNNVG